MRSLGRPFFQDVPDLEINPDASLAGWGACCNGVRTRGCWTLADTGKYINDLELLGAMYVVRAFCSSIIKYFDSYLLRQRLRGGLYQLRGRY